MFSTEILGFIGGALGIFFGLPQALRIRRLGHGRGLSLISWLLQLGVATSWAAYGFDKNSPSLLATNMAAGLINASVVWVILNNRLRAMLTISILVVCRRTSTYTSRIDRVCSSYFTCLRTITTSI